MDRQHPTPSSEMTNGHAMVGSIPSSQVSDALSQLHDIKDHIENQVGHIRDKLEPVLAMNPRPNLPSPPPEEGRVSLAAEIDAAVYTFRRISNELTDLVDSIEI